MLEDDLNGLLTTSTSLKLIIISIFKKLDSYNYGYISYKNFMKILQKFKSKLNNSEILKIALRYEYIHENNEKNEKYENTTYEEYINNFRNNEISGTIKGDYIYVYEYIFIYIYMYIYVYIYT